MFHDGLDVLVSSDRAERLSLKYTDLYVLSLIRRGAKSMIVPPVFFLAYG